MTHPELSLMIPSEHYGSLCWQYLGTVDIRNKPADDIWWKKYHPVRFFSSYWPVDAETVVLSNGDAVVVRFAVWTVTKAVNKGWKPIAGTPYALCKPTYRGCPIAYSDARVQKWQRVSAGMLVDNPHALEQAQQLLSKAA